MTETKKTPAIDFKAGKTLLETKRAVSILCKYLNLVCGASIKPDHFRLAKYNKTDDDVVKKFWELLSKLALELDEVRIHEIKQYFKHLDYKNKHFYDVPEDMSGGSKQLLIAFAFLIHVNGEKILKRYINKTAFAENFEIFKNDPVVTKGVLKTNQITSLDDYKNYKRWLQGKIQQNRKAVADIEEHNTKLISKMKNYICVDVDKLTFAEVLALSSSQYRDVFLKNSENVIDTLKYYESWLRVSPLFWKWLLFAIEKNIT